MQTQAPHALALLAGLVSAVARLAIDSERGSENRTSRARAARQK